MKRVVVPLRANKDVGFSVCVRTAFFQLSPGGNKLFALYQGTTLVVPLGPAKMWALAPA